MAARFSIKSSYGGGQSTFELTQTELMVAPHPFFCSHGRPGKTVAITNDDWPSSMRYSHQASCLLQGMPGP